MNGSSIGLSCRFRGAAMAAVVACGTLAGTSLTLLTPGPTAGAAVAACGASLGTTQVQGAAGSFIFVVPVVPATPGQACNAILSVTGTIATATGTRPSDVVGNGLAHTVTVSFLPGQPAPELLWQWSPHCADPSSAPWQFSASSPAAGTVATPLSGVSPCSGFGTTSSTLVGPTVSVPNPQDVVAMASTPGDLGYWLVSRGGSPASFGDAAKIAGPTSNAPVVGAADATAGGYWWAASDGGVFALGTASFFGSMGGTALVAPVVGMAATPDHNGYWLVAADGGIFAFGDAGFYGSVPGALGPGRSLNQPVVGMAASPDGKGYWLVAADGGIFAFGDAAYQGSMGGTQLNQPVVGMAGDTSGGYWLVARDGGIFAFHATFFGSLGGIALNAPVTTMAATSDGKGYWLAGADGGVFAFGDAPFRGSSG